MRDLKNQKIRFKWNKIDYFDSYKKHHEQHETSPLQINFGTVQKHNFLHVFRLNFGTVSSSINEWTRKNDFNKDDEHVTSLKVCGFRCMYVYKALLSNLKYDLS